MSIGSTASLPGWNANGNYSVAPGAALAVGNAVTAGNIAAMLATTNFGASANLGFDTSNGDRTYSGSLSDTNQGALGVIKVGLNTLLLSGSNAKRRHDGQCRRLVDRVDSRPARLEHQRQL